jgi:hypothetical protein
MANKFIIVSLACCLAVAAFLLGAVFGASRQEIDDEHAQRIINEFREEVKIFDWDWVHIETLCEKGIEANSKKILPLYRKYFSDMAEFYRDFFKGRKGFKHIETDYKIVIKTPTGMIRMYKNDKCTDNEIIAALKKSLQTFAKTGN